MKNLGKFVVEVWFAELAVVVVVGREPLSESGGLSRRGCELECNLLRTVDGQSDTPQKGLVAGSMLTSNGEHNNEN